MNIKLTNGNEILMNALVELGFIEGYEIKHHYAKNKNDDYDYIAYAYASGCYYETLADLKNAICNIDNYNIEDLTSEDLEVLKRLENL